MGSPVVHARTQAGGCSPGVASRIELADGRRLFLKAVSAQANPDSPEIYRREARVAAALPRGIPAPCLLWIDEDPPWVALAFEEVVGRPPPAPLAPSRTAPGPLRPHPDEPGPDPLAPQAPHLRTGVRAHVPELADGPEGGGPPSGPCPLRPLGPGHLRELVRSEGEFGPSSVGRTLLHGDIRADNLLLAPRGVHFVDWAWACRGAAWIDLLAFLPSVAMQGGPPPWELFDPHPLARSARPERVDALLAAFGGFFLFHGSAPAPVGLPTLRPFQWAQGQQVLRWLRYRWEGGDPPEGTVPAFRG